MKSKMRLLAPFLFSLVSYPALSATSADYARMSQDAWSAFECSALAGAAEMLHEQEHMAHYGYERGKAFFAASAAGKISGEDFTRDVPLVVTILSQGPSDDFMLGRIYEFARRSALGGVVVQGDEEATRVAAKERYARNNCDRFSAAH
jgi:hypothetical protein